MEFSVNNLVKAETYTAAWQTIAKAAKTHVCAPASKLGSRLIRKSADIFVCGMVRADLFYQEYQPKVAAWSAGVAKSGKACVISRSISTAKTMRAWDSTVSRVIAKGTAGSIALVQRGAAKITSYELVGRVTSKLPATPKWAANIAKEISRFTFSHRGKMNIAARIALYTGATVISYRITKAIAIWGHQKWTAETQRADDAEAATAAANARADDAEAATAAATARAETAEATTTAARRSMRASARRARNAEAATAAANARVAELEPRLTAETERAAALQEILDYERNAVRDAEAALNRLRSLRKDQRKGRR